MRHQHRLGLFAWIVILLFALLLLSLVFLAACGTKQSTSATTPSATTISPPTGSVAAVQYFFALINSGDYAQARADLAPGSPYSEPSASGQIWGIKHIRLLSAKVFTSVPPTSTTAELVVDVVVTPGKNAGSLGPDGKTARRPLYVQLRKGKAGLWRVYSMGTG